MNNLKSLEAEQWVIGSILNSPDSILIISDIISPDDFYSKRNQIIYSNCLELWIDGDLDTLHLTERLKEKGQLEESGGIDYIVSLITVTPTSANIKHHAEIVKKFAVLRNLYKLGNNLIQTITDTSDIKRVETFEEDRLKTAATEIFPWEQDKANTPAPRQDFVTFPEKTKPVQRLNGVISVKDMLSKS